MQIFQMSSPLLRFLGRNSGMQPLQEKVTAIGALEPPKDIDELRQFLGLVGFYKKFTPSFMDVTVCLNTMLRKGAVFKWTEQCGNTFRLLKSELEKMPRLQYPNPDKPFMLFTDASKHSYSRHSPSRGNTTPSGCRGQPHSNSILFRLIW